MTWRDQSDEDGLTLQERPAYALEYRMAMQENGAEFMASAYVFSSIVLPLESSNLYFWNIYDRSLFFLVNIGLS